VGIGTDNNSNALTVNGNVNIISAVDALSSVTFTGETKTNTATVTALDTYIQVLINGDIKYLRLFDVI